MDLLGDHGKTVREGMALEGGFAPVRERAF
jgi:hypothetical protein